MADREIKIPFGPDRTGGYDLSSLIPEVEPASGEEQGLVDEGPIDVAVSDARSDDLAATDRFSRVGAADYEGVDAFGADSSSGGISVSAEIEPGAAQDAASASYSDDEQFSDDEDMEQAGGSEASAAAAAALAGMQSSFVALKDSIGQGRELKAREKERDSFGEKLAADQEELADREDILANYNDRIAEQDDIIYQATYQREALKAELSHVTAQQEEAADSLQRMRDYHDSQLEPVEAMLGRAKATAEQAKNDERSRKSELNAAETERRKAEGSDDAAMAFAKYEVTQQAYEEASARSEAAKEALDKVQKQYDDLKEQVEQAEAPLERSIDDLSARAEELKGSVAELAETISVARKRRQYCDMVYQYPEETAKLRESVEADEEIARQMDIENDELREQLAESKEHSKIAKIGIAAVILVIIIIIIAVFVFGH